MTAACDKIYQAVSVCCPTSAVCPAGREVLGDSQTPHLQSDGTRYVPRLHIPHLLISHYGGDHLLHLQFHP